MAMWIILTMIKEPGGFTPVMRYSWPRKKRASEKDWKKEYKKVNGSKVYGLL